MIIKENPSLHFILRLYKIFSIVDPSFSYLFSSVHVSVEMTSRMNSVIPKNSKSGGYIVAIVDKNAVQYVKTEFSDFRNPVFDTHIIFYNILNTVSRPSCLNFYFREKTDIKDEFNYHKTTTKGTDSK